MSAAHIFAKFAHDFGVPFLLGQKCTIANPLGPAGADAVAYGLDIELALTDALQRQITDAALFCEICPAPFDEQTGVLLYAVHELFAACHPQAASFYSRAHLYCEAAEERLLKLPRTYDAPQLLARHLIVKRCFSAHRTDVHLKWWTGSASFYGTEPPVRLSAWPSLRRVNEEKKKSPMWRIALVDGDEETRVARTSLLTALLDISPLTRLMLLGDPVQKELPFSLMLPFKHKGKRMSTMYLLEDKALTRSITDQLLEVGVDACGPMLALALLAAVREGAPPLVQQRAAELCTHLFLMMCIIESQNPGAPEARALRALLDDDVAQMPDPQRVYWATVMATLSLRHQSFVLPTAEELGTIAGGLWQQAESRLRHPHIEIIGDPLARELKRRLPPIAGANVKEAALN